MLSFEGNTFVLCLFIDLIVPHYHVKWHTRGLPNNK